MQGKHWSRCIMGIYYCFAPILGVKVSFIIFDLSLFLHSVFSVELCLQ